VGKIGLGLGIAKKGYGILGKVFSKSKSKASSTINSVKPVANKDSAHKIEMAKIPGRVKRAHSGMMDSSDKTLSAWRQVTQKLDKRPFTKSGISKGKDLKKK
jgi:hypothetical protein